MNNRSLRFLRFRNIVLALAISAGSHLLAQPATEIGAPGRGKMQLNVDPKPIDRNAADRVSYAPIVKRTGQSIVYVYSSRQVRQDPHAFMNDPLFRRFFNVPEGRQAPEGERRTPESQRRRAPGRTQHGLGSGVIATKDGYILTNNHVIDGADDVKVSIGDSPRRYDAKVVGGDAMADIAVLKIDTDIALTPATFGDSDQLEVGDVVLAIGNPFGIGQSVSSGIVSALSRGNLGIEQIEDFIQTDAAINRGNSGGALLDSAGRVVGINTAIVSGGPMGGFSGVGFAIPINLARNVAEQIVDTGRVERGFLGVQPQELTSELAGQFGTDTGALIAQVTDDSPAAKAGLREGDVITGINDIEIRDPRQLLLTVSQFRPETSVTVHYLRDGKEQTAEVQLTRRPESSADPEQGIGSSDDDGVLNGVGIADLTPEARSRLSIPARIEGVVVTSIEPGSPAAAQGLRVGDIVMELNRQKITNADEAVRLSGATEGPKVMLLIWRNGRNQYLVIDESKVEGRE